MFSSNRQTLTKIRHKLCHNFNYVTDMTNCIIFYLAELSVIFGAKRGQCQNWPCPMTTRKVCGFLNVGINFLILILALNCEV